MVRKLIKRQLRRVEAAVRKLHKLVMASPAEPKPKKKRAKKKRKKKRR